MQKKGKEETGSKIEKEKKGKYIEPLKKIYENLVIIENPVPEPFSLKKYDENDLLPREFYRQDVVTLSQELLGKILVSETSEGIVKCMIVETEAYKAPLDKGCHAYNGKKTDRTQNFWLDGGHVYMYSIYGANYCFNVVAAKEGEPEAVLVRAVEPIENIQLIKQRRQMKSKKLKELTGGPAKFTKAMDIDMRHNGVDLTKKGNLYIIKGKERKFEIQRTKRINIDYAGEWTDKLWRFTIRGNDYISV